MVMAIKVKQDMIDFIKNQGMTAALKRAGQLKAKGGKGEAEFLEGVRRMYGSSRLDAATAKASAGAAKAAPSTRRKYGTPNNTSKPQMVDAKGPNAVKSGKFDASRAASASLQGKSAKASMEAGRSGPKMPGKGPAARMTESSTRRKYGTPNTTSKTAAAKKSTTTDPFAKAVFGGLGALGRTLSVEPRVTAAQAKKNLEAKKRAAANKNK